MWRGGREGVEGDRGRGDRKGDVDIESDSAKSVTDERDICSR